MSFAQLSYPFGINVKQYRAQGDGVTDDTVAVQNAINAGMGTVLFPSGTYLTSNLTIPAKTRLLGVGASSQLKAKSGTVGNYISLASPTTSINVEIANLWIDGTAAGGSLVGIRLDNTGYNGDDVRHRIIDTYINGFGGDNLQLGTNIRESVFIGVSSYHAGGRGFQIESGCTDNKFSCCTSGVSLGVGFNIQGNNNLFSNCKAFWAGTADGISWVNTVDGWFVGGSGNQQAAILVGCESQDNARHGFSFFNNGFNLNNCVLSACLADSNNASNNNGVGFQINGLTDSSISGCTSVNRSGGKGSQPYGAQLLNTLTGCTFIGNSFFATTGPYLFSSASGYQVEGDAVYNPVGPLTAPGVPASGTAIQNMFGVTVVVYTNSGSISDIQVGNTSGSTVSTGQNPSTSGISNILGPGQWIKMVYSSTPTWKWFGL